jgi:hypothetical protein
MILGIVLRPNSCPEYLPFNFSVDKIQELVGGSYGILSLKHGIAAYTRTGYSDTLNKLPVNLFFTHLYLMKYPYDMSVLVSLRGTCVLTSISEKGEESLSDEQLDYINQEYFKFICTNNHER